MRNAFGKLQFSVAFLIQMYFIYTNDGLIQNVLPWRLTVAQVYLGRNILHFFCFHIERHKIATIKYRTYEWNWSKGKATSKANSFCLIHFESETSRIASMYKTNNTPSFKKTDQTTGKIPCTSNKYLSLSVQPKRKVNVYSKTKIE